MNAEFGPISNFHTASVSDVVFKCDICALTFRTPAERNVHILEHLPTRDYFVCHQSLVQLGNIWYSVHEHFNQSLVKAESSDEINAYEPLALICGDGDESQSDALKIKWEIDPIGDTGTNFDGNVSDATASELNPEDVNVTNTENDSQYQIEYIEQKPISITGKLDEHSEIIDNQIDEQRVDAIASTVTSDEANSQSKYKKVVLKGKVKGVCEICSKQFMCLTGLKYHMNMHLGVKPYVCDICNKSFADKRNLNKHIQQAKCKATPKKSSNSDADGANATSARESVENGEMERIKFSKGGTCGVCQKNFICRTGLKYHMNLHLGVRPYECDICDKAYADKRNLTGHRKTHELTVDPDDDVEVTNVELKDLILTNQQMDALACPICQKKLTRRCGLKSHMKVHKTPHLTCKLCRSIFTTKEKYRAHKAAVHEMPAEIRIKNYGENEPEKENVMTDWMCEYCNSDFKLEINLAKHILNDHSIDKCEHLCNICPEKFTLLNDLLAHMRAHPESKQHKCTYDGCDHCFAYTANLGVHLDKHNQINGSITRKTQDDVTEITTQHAIISLRGSCKQSSLYENAFTCHICSKKMSNRTRLLLHIQLSHSNERTKCTVGGCDRVFKSNPGLFQHIRVTHPQAVKKCDLCRRTFYSAAKLAEHRLRHSSKEPISFACNHCDKTFTRRHRLRAHISQHAKEVTCNVCDEKFTSVASMMAHRERPGKRLLIRCRFPDCNRTFENRRELMIHASHHPDSGKKKRMCPQCGKSFSQSFYNDHMNMHAGRQPYERTYCKKTFSRMTSLRRHIHIHTGKKPYACDITGCRQAYRDSIDLKRHKFRVHKIYTKKHICPICSQVFPERKLLRNHTVKVHDKVEIVAAPETI